MQKNKLCRNIESTVHDFFSSWIIFLISTCPISVGTKNRRGPVFLKSALRTLAICRRRTTVQEVHFNFSSKALKATFVPQIIFLLQSSYDGIKACFASIEKPSNEKRQFADDAASAGANLKIFLPVGKRQKLKRRSNINVKCGSSGFLSRLPCLRKQ